MSRRYTFQDVKELVENEGYELKSSEKDIINEKGFVLTSTKIEVWCQNPNHKHSFPQLSKFLKGARCRQCLVDSRRLKYDDVKKYIESFGYELISDSFIDVHKDLVIECSKGHEFNMQYANFQQGQRCPHCYNSRRSKEKKYSYEYVKTYIEEEGYELLSDEYTNSNGHLVIKCPNGHIWRTGSFNTFKNSGHRCPKCKESKGENEVKKILNELDIKYESQYRFEDCRFKYALPFDFYLSKYNCCIEYDGEFHYEFSRFSSSFDKFVEGKIRDAIKNVYCKNNNIKLIRIPYWEFDNIKEILIDELNL